MDQNNMYQQENSAEQQTGQAQNSYMQPAEQVPNAYTQPTYQQPTYQPIAGTEEVSVGDWMLTIFLMCIPVVNLVMLLIWAFGGSVPASKANYCKAQLIWMLIGICLSVLLFILGIAVGFGLFSSYMGSVL